MTADPQTSRPEGRSLNVTLVLSQQGWIFEKINRRLVEHLPRWGVNAEIAPTPSPRADFNHFILLDPLFDVSLPFAGTRRSIFVTHVDRVIKQMLLKRQSQQADVLICMSRMTVEQLVEGGIPRNKLCYVTIAHDGVIQPRRVVLGITARLRPDGAKREDILIDAIKTLRMDAFHFDIIGSGWERVIPLLEASGATVRYHPGTTDVLADYRVIVERVPRFDYYLYFGFDEGSMGTLDALAAGVPTIITPQGFHLDIPHAITHSFTRADELAAILGRIIDDRNARIRSVSQLTWNEYARKHAAIWRAALDGTLAQITSTLNAAPPGAVEMPQFSRMDRWRQRCRFWLPPNAEALRVDLSRIAMSVAGPRVVRRLKALRDRRLRPAQGAAQ